MVYCRATITALPTTAAHLWLFTYLVVKEEVDRGDEEALEGVEEVGREGPDGEGQPGSSQRVRPHEVQHVGDAQQRQQEEQTLERFPRKKD